MAGLKEKLVEMLGGENVVDRDDVLDEYAADSSYEKGARPVLAVKPRDGEEIEKLILYAGDKDLGLVACSSGPPRFYGDTVPAREGCLIVDLSGMKRTIKFNRRNRVAMIEPGVTFEELQKEAERHGLKVLMPLLPRPNKSIVGSYLEREPILIPKYHWDVTDPLLCTEVVFGTGEVFRTGSAAGPGDIEDQWASERYQKNPMGPGQTDLVRVLQGAQGTMGIVTWASVRLEMLPTIRRTYFAGSESFEKIADVVYEMLRRRLGDECLIMNSRALAAVTATGEDTGGETPSGLPPWILAYSVAGYRRLPEARIYHQEKDVAGILARSGLKAAEELGGISAAGLQERLEKPWKDSYWKLRHGEGCKDIFFITILDQVPQYLEVMREVAGEQGYPLQDIGVYIQPLLQGRCCHMEFMFYNRGDLPREKMRELFESSSRRLAEAGAFFSRPYGIWGEIAYDRCPDTVEMSRKVKKIFDPGGIMNPGKLCF